MTAIEFSREARVELDAAADHYEADFPGRGVRFYDAVERALRLIDAMPTASPLFPGVQPARAIRRCLVRGFPYALAYRVVGDLIRIEAVAHTHRRPGYWVRRTR
ncbi:MAG: type II toxin-antitoxin system RelE/ParE family toxin [Kofleriaceae bacterium]|nr:type II toxin-antitoxin system RelE/ParE family toxin [Kofleriaceae bacterium]MBP9166289.1 type II toxin-antitoxin system RelE/ParE family toxin [Kofleriaceae bacterium]MBP9858683.1 type II toxin-antitoxin system RelE/ParE family toxin [Kofleriaceae bacterium]